MVRNITLNIFTTSLMLLRRLLLPEPGLYWMEDRLT